MAIAADRVSVVTAGDLLDADLRIPHYQRPYSWEPGTALQLLDDIKVAFDAREPREGVRCVLGAVILHDDDGRLDVVDGQQRLLTLRIIQTLLDGRPMPTANGADSPVSRVWTSLSRRIGTWPAQERADLQSFVRERCELVQVVTDDVDEAFRVFDSQNFRGKALAPHDLLKAHHLRHMSGESEPMTTAVVEAWESAGDGELDRLFSTFLYRIARWSRGESAPRFAARDVGMFKGISVANDRAPSAQYHLAAHTALPMLTAWTAASSPEEERNAARARFQIDAPAPAGRPFFEMIAFMLRELEQLRKEAYEHEWEPFSAFEPGGLEQKPGASRYRYVSELYLAALLYYTNKFGGDELSAARQSLFAWAYTPRVELQRVQFRSIDNRARGGREAQSPFALLREASAGGAVHQLSTSVKQRSPDHERSLAALLQELGAS
jgi:hypothetical protein